MTKRLWFALLAFLVSGCTGLPSLSDATVVEVTRASADDIARYENAGYIRLPPSSSTAGGWPVVRLAIRSSRDLRSSAWLEAELCTARNDETWRPFQWEVGLLWNDRPIEEIPLDLEKARQEQPQQEYELFFRYEHRGHKYTPETGERVNLLPLPDDLCIAFYHPNWPLWTGYSVGDPLRIDRDVINAVVGPLPRTIPPS